MTAVRTCLLYQPTSATAATTHQQYQPTLATAAATCLQYQPTSATAATTHLQYQPTSATAITSCLQYQLTSATAATTHQQYQPTSTTAVTSCLLHVCSMDLHQQQLLHHVCYMSAVWTYISNSCYIMSVTCLQYGLTSTTAVMSGLEAKNLLKRLGWWTKTCSNLSRAHCMQCSMVAGNDFTVQYGKSSSAGSCCNKHTLHTALYGSCLQDYLLSHHRKWTCGKI